MSALFAALSVVSLYFASVWPTGQLGFVAFSSLFVAAAVIEMGIAPGIYVFVVSSVLGMLILPNRVAPLLYILFFGYYPVVKSLIERTGRAAIQWILKLAVFNASLSIIWLFLRGLLFDFGENTLGTMMVYLFGNAIFAVFDYGFSKVIWYYQSSISKYIKKDN